MRSWTVTRRTPDAVLAMTHETLTVKSFDDERDAAVEVLAQLGFAMLPCCDDAAPCAECRDHDRLDADDRLEWAGDAQRMEREP